LINSLSSLEQDAGVLSRNANLRICRAKRSALAPARSGGRARDFSATAGAQALSANFSALRRTQTAEQGGNSVLSRNDRNEQLLFDHFRRGKTLRASDGLRARLDSLAPPVADGAAASHEPT
jgi:hypothetical protein